MERLARGSHQSIERLGASAPWPGTALRIFAWAVQHANDGYLL